MRRAHIPSSQNPDAAKLKSEQPGRVAQRADILATSGVAEGRARSLWLVHPFQSGRH